MKATYNVAFDYELWDSVLLDLGTTLYVFNDLVRFISEIEPSIDCVYVGSHTEEIVGFGTAVVTIDTPEGKEQIRLIEAAYIPNFYTNLVCLQKLNDKGIYWNNKENLLYYGDNVIYTRYSYYYGQSIFKYNELKAKDLQKVSFVT